MSFRKFYEFCEVFPWIYFAELLMSWVTGSKIYDGFMQVFCGFYGISVWDFIWWRR